MFARTMSFGKKWSRNQDPFIATAERQHCLVASESLRYYDYQYCLGSATEQYNRSISALTL